MKLSWMMEDRLTHEVELGLAPALSGVVGSPLEDVSLSELETLAIWLEGKMLSGPDRQHVREEIERRAKNP